MTQLFYFLVGLFSMAAVIHSQDGKPTLKTFIMGVSLSFTLTFIFSTILKI